MQLSRILTGMRNSLALTASAALCSFAGLTSSRAQTVAAPVASQPRTAVSSAERREMIDGLLRQLRSLYVFPDRAAKIDAAIRGRQRVGGYDGVASGEELAGLLTRHLQEVAHDKHLAVTYSAEALSGTNAALDGQVSTAGLIASSLEGTDAWKARIQRMNYGFRDISILEGNIGYLNLVGFAPAQAAWDTTVAAMGLLTNTDALIIDLRDNMGGSPQTATMIATYLLASLYQPIHLNDICWGPQNTVEQYWTLPYVPGKMYAGKDVYLLTSARTFSTAEEFAYDLQALKRVTIVGERTAGGARVGTTRRLTDHFSVFVPSGRSINPITKTNWEGSGVAPDLAVPAKSAFDVAYVSALKKRIAVATDSADRVELNQALGKNRLGSDTARP